MKKLISVLLIVLLTISLIGCTTDNNPDNDIIDEDPIENEDNNNQDDEDQDNDINEPAPEANSQEVVLYFANAEYVDTGNEDLEHLITETRVIEYEDLSLEEAIIRELMKGPESEELTSPIPSTLQLLDVEVSEGIAYVNFDSEGLNGGSLQEYFTIEEIVNSLVELDHIDKVQFLIDGEEAESLMGHIEIMDPFE